MDRTKIKKSLLIEEIEQLNKRYRTLTNNLNVGLYRSTTDHNGRFIEVNKAFLSMFGYRSEKELFRIKVSDLYQNIDDRKKFQKEIKSKGFVKNREVVLKKKSGKTFIASLSTVAVQNSAGIPVYYDGFVEDITKQKLSQNAIRNSEYKYRTLIESFYDIIFITSYEGRMLFANPALKKHTGYDMNDFRSAKVKEPYGYPEDIKKLKDFVSNFIRKKSKNSGFIENRFVDKEGKTHWFSTVITKIEFDGKPALQFIVRDITRQKKAAGDLLKKEEQYRTLFSLSPNGILIEDETGKMIDVNPAFCKLMGYDKNQLIGKNVSMLAHPNARNQTKANIKKILGGEQLKHVVKSLRKDGTLTYAYLNERTFELPDGRPGIISMVEDITDRIKAEQTLKESEQKYRLLIENQTDFVVKLDLKGGFSFVSPSFCDLLGKPEAELLQTKFTSLVNKEDLSKVSVAMIEVTKPPYQIHFEISLESKNGPRWIEWKNNAVLDDQNKIIEIIGVGRDGTEKKITREALSRSEESYRGLFNSTTDAIYIQDIKGRFIDVNDGAVKMYGYSRKEFIGKTPEFLAAPGKNDMSEAMKAVKQAFLGRPQTINFWGITRSRRVFPKEVRLNKGTYFGQDVVVALAQDITERMAAQKVLEEKERRFRRIFNAFPDIYFRSSIDGIIHEISPSVYKITGYRPEEVIGKDSFKFYYSQSDWQLIGKKLEQSEEVNDFDTRIKTKDNRILNCSFSAKLIYDESKNPIGLEGALRDITDRIKSEKAIKESQRRLSTLMANLPGMAYRCKHDRHWTMEFVSQGIFDLTGYNPEDLINNNKLSYNDIIHPEDRKMVWKKTQKALANKQSFRFTYRIITRQKEVLWVWEQGTGVYTSDDRLIALEGFITNITDQIEAEIQVRKLSRSIEQSPTIVIITDLNGDIEYVNPKFTRITGYSLKEVIGRNPRFLKSGHTRSDAYRELWETITSGKEWYGEFLNRKKNKELYWESAHIFPIKDENGKITHFIGMKEDITERKKMERELIVAKEKAEESDRLKSAFLANMSHEIRTPMNSIIGFSQLLDDSELDDKERSKYISLIHSSGNDLMNLIDDIIDISKIEAGQMKIFKAQYLTNNLLTEIFENFKEYKKTKPDKNRVDLRYIPPQKASESFIYTDIDRFKQVFKNLLNNAIKFTDSGYIEFGFRPLVENSRSYILFWVKDTGIGIAPDKIEIVFNSFTQANESNTKIYGGTGLGLAISRKIVEALDGRIWVESEEGVGSTFYFTLPAQQLNRKITEYFTEKKREKLSFNWKGRQILVVEDDDKSYEVFESILKKTRIKIVRAEDGLQALNHFKQNEFDVILMDIRLPRLDGYKTMKKIKKINSDVPVIAQTAYAMQGEREKCIRSGFNDYISKPVRIDDLLNMIGTYIPVSEDAG